MFKEYLKPTVTKIIASFVISFVSLIIYIFRPLYMLELFDVVFDEFYFPMLLGLIKKELLLFVIPFSIIWYLVISILSAIIFKKFSHGLPILIATILILFLLFGVPRVSYEDNAGLASASWVRSCKCFGVALVGIHMSHFYIASDLPNIIYCFGIPYNCSEEGYKLEGR